MDLGFGKQALHVHEPSNCAVSKLLILSAGPAELFGDVDRYDKRYCDRDSARRVRLESHGPHCMNRCFIQVRVAARRHQNRFGDDPAGIYMNTQYRWPDHSPLRDEAGDLQVEGRQGAKIFEGDHKLRPARGLRIVGVRGADESSQQPRSGRGQNCANTMHERESNEQWLILADHEFPGLAVRR